MKHPIALPNEPSGPTIWRRSLIGRLLTTLLGLILFVVALHLLKTGASSFGSRMLAWFAVDTPLAALGFGWLLAYVFLSGSPVAAIAISFFAVGSLDPLQTFAMITGSRLGAAFVILGIGMLYGLRGRHEPQSASVGVLALLTTAAIYLPALLPGAWLIAQDWLGRGLALAIGDPTSPLDWLAAPLLHLLNQWLPAWGLLLLGLLCLLAAFALFDLSLPQIALEDQASGWVAKLISAPHGLFCLGAAVTAFTLSVSVSLALLVPLVARGVLRRERVIPYVMGANITTFIDTLAAALILGGAPAFTIVAIEVFSVGLLSLLILIFAYHPFERAILAIEAATTRSWPRVWLFVLLLLVVPLVILLLA